MFAILIINFFIIINHDGIYVSGDIGSNGNCFVDCYSKGSQYIGIRSRSTSGECKKWSSTYYKNSYSTIKSNFCNNEGEDYLWCVYYSGNYWDYCEIPKCQNRVTKCVESSITGVTTKYIQGNWTKPIDIYSLIGYLVLLHNSDDECIQYSLHGEIKNQNNAASIQDFIISCMEEKKSIDEDLKFKFVNLYNDHEYKVYIIPVIDEKEIGSIKKIIQKTKLAKPAQVKNVRITDIDINSMSISWDKSMKSQNNGAATRYKVILANVTFSKFEIIGSNYKTFREIDQCTKYCITVVAMNQAGSSSESQLVCDKTLAPELGTVEIKKIENNLKSSREITWKYKGTDLCLKSYKLTIWKVNEEKLSKTYPTSGTSFIVKSLELNQFYKVKVTVYSIFKTKDGKVEKDSNIQLFFIPNNDVTCQGIRIKEYITIKNKFNVIVISVLGILVAILILIVLILILKKSREKEKTDDTKRDNTQDGGVAYERDNTQDGGVAYERDNTQDGGVAYERDNTYDGGGVYEKDNIYDEGDVYEKDNIYDGGDVYEKDNIYDGGDVNDMTNE